MAAQWYGVLVGLLLFVLGILLFGTYSVEGPAYAWLALVLGVMGIIVGFASERK